MSSYLTAASNATQELTSYNEFSRTLCPDMTSWVTSNPSLHGASEARGKQNVAPLAKASVGKAARGMMSPTSSAAEPKFFNFIWTAFLPVNCNGAGDLEGLKSDCLPFIVDYDHEVVSILSAPALLPTLNLVSW